MQMLDGKVYRIEDKNSNSSELLIATSEITQTTKTDDHNTYGWGYWTSFTHNNSNIEGNLFYFFVDSLNTPDLTSQAFVNQVAEFSFAGGYAIDASGSSAYDLSESTMSVNFSSGGFSTTLSAVSEAAEWSALGSGNLSDLSNLNLSGSVIYSDQSNADVAGLWDLMWGGDEGQLLGGSFKLSGGKGRSSDYIEGVAAFDSDLIVFDTAAEQNNATTFGLISTQWGDAGSQGTDLFAITSQTTSSITEELYINSNGALQSFETGSSWITLTNDQLALVESGSTTLSDGSEVNWGRWGSLQAADYEGTTENLQQLHYMLASNLTSSDVLAAKTGTVSYSLIDGTTPTMIASDGTVSLASLDSMTIGVDFDNDSMNVSMQVSSETLGGVLSASGSGHLDSFTGSGVSLDVSGATTGTGNIQGQFVGADAEGIMSLYELNTAAGDISGTSLLEQAR
ncbi:hypothetical protein [Oceanospirillum sanctuarii]|uniref:hypothetical protein n=1 Tax=Oceanospirillum sanctuarii TaxID=1434821 RepID=UPI001592F2CE|nr:hypothetical protein [Oceanospirillum sanctuarii]